MISNLDPVLMFFCSLSSITILSRQQKHLDDNTINIHKNYDSFCTASALNTSYSAYEAMPVQTVTIPPRAYPEQSSPVSEHQ
jgi:hypothetical protein